METDRKTLFFLFLVFEMFFLMLAEPQSLMLTSITPIFNFSLLATLLSVSLYMFSKLL